MNDLTVTESIPAQLLAEGDIIKFYDRDVVVHSLERSTQADGVGWVSISALEIGTYPPGVPYRWPVRSAEKVDIYVQTQDAKTLQALSGRFVSLGYA